MKITAQEEYGLRCILQLAREEGNRELGGAMAELRSLLEELGEDPDAALDDLLIDETGQEAQA